MELSRTRKPSVVLVVDPDQNTRRLVRTNLSDCGLQVIEAENAEAALAVFFDSLPDLVLLDVALPDASGFDVCKEIRQSPEGTLTPILIVTESDDPDSIDLGFDAGATQYRTKPYSWSLLGREVQYMLRASSALRGAHHQEDRLRFLAYYDALTELPNRRSFLEQLENTVNWSSRTGRKAAVMFIDLDHFKRINDSIGHDMGDKLLVEIATRLKTSLRETDETRYSSRDSIDGDEKMHASQAARLGGDEFTVIVNNLDDKFQARGIAKRLLKTLSEPVTLGDHSPVVTPSIGISFYPDDGEDADTLVRNADSAMYVAKGEGRANYQFYRTGMNNLAIEELMLEEQLRYAIVSGELEVQYQPVINAIDGTIESVEALMRWNHPDRGIVHADQFLPVAERTGMIVQLGEWVLSEIADATKGWDNTVASSMRVSMNLSALQLAQPEITNWFVQYFDGANLHPERIGLEFSESAIMTNAADNVRTLNFLAQLGIELTVDNFGTGYSSLQHLHEFPIHAVKIDKTFIDNVEKPAGLAIIQGVVGLCQGLGITPIANGVEQGSQRDLLIAAGCHLLQGYLYSDAMAASELPEYIESIEPNEGQAASTVQ
ncbi:hypothetical protein A3709_20425 [Halioglobus sp. HI00S01]|uniref:two-component system response regulator n=1 Tax=Halioglobus sp. HI00S01 TaxID=1822214 RepID=UPI0007C1FEC4|nr:EAL domain-containing protein [Halioglobus sp. HI00S01]KZX57979.1 hypothetical protein A3709_20425 [Halioglobus sp. HI00S01]